MNFIKARRVPLWMTIFGLLMGLGGTFIGVQALIDPTTAADFVDGADKMGIAWGGRNLGVGIAMVVAVLLRNVHAYAAGFAAGFCRELSDVIAGLSDGGSLTATLAVFGVIGIVEAVCFVLCVQNSRAADAEAAA
ncbi:MAG: hypothetical protein AAGD35_04175 [Actinomycetota bacterium]